MKTDAFHATLSASADSSNRSAAQGHTPREKISRKHTIAEAETSSVPNGLRRLRRKTGSARSDRSRKGWSPERRARQAALIRNWAPWRQSTGPKTEAGKTSCAKNALKHGRRSRATIREYQRIRNVLRLVAQNIARVRLLIRLRDASLRIKYKFPPAALGRRGVVLSGSGGGRSVRIRNPRGSAAPVSALTPRV